MSPTPARSETICDQMGHLLDPNGKCYRCGQFPPPPLAPATSLTPAQEALRALAEKATPGNWQVSGVRQKFPIAGQAHAVGPDGDTVALVFYDPKHHAQHWADACFIAAAHPQAVLGLLDALAAAREAVEQARLDIELMRQRHADELRATDDQAAKAESLLDRSGTIRWEP